MENRAVYRCHYRGRLETDDPAQISPLMDQCADNARAMIAEGKMMTAALYYFGRQLFLYYEALGETFRPETFMGPLHPLLASWPEKEDTFDWAQMYNIYWHNVPQGEQDWKRVTRPERRRGRIAYLKQETMFRYVYHHFAIVEEGLLQGDKYQSIALHEDVLFSYFEEPKRFTNIQRDPTRESKAIQDWLDVDPESHFIPLPGSEGQNFLLLPDYFALGQED